MDLTIRDLPSSVLNDLERAARRHGRSVNDEAIARLSRHLASPASDVRAELAEIDRVRDSLSVPWLTPDHLNAAVDEGRP